MRDASGSGCRRRLPTRDQTGSRCRKRLPMSDPAASRRRKCFARAIPAHWAARGVSPRPISSRSKPREPHPRLVATNEPRLALSVGGSSSRRAFCGSPWSLRSSHVQTTHACRPRSRSNDDVDVPTENPQVLEQPVRGETAQAPSQQRRDLGLIDAQEPRGLGLGGSLRGDDLGNPGSEFRFRQGLVGRRHAQVGKDVAAAGSTCASAPPSTSRLEHRPIMSSGRSSVPIARTKRDSSSCPVLPTPDLSP